MNKWVVIIVFFSLLFSCKERVSSEFPAPDNLLSQQQMITILTELSVVEASYQMKYIQVSRYSTVLQKDADSIFNVFKTDNNAFEASMEYYGYHQEKLAEIYQTVKENIEKRQRELPDVSEEITVVQDTVPTIEQSTAKVLTEEDIRIPN